MLGARVDMPRINAKSMIRSDAMRRSNFVLVMMPNTPPLLHKPVQVCLGHHSMQGGIKRLWYLGPRTRSPEFPENASES
jgi:hypothetical protein